jgi:hypothetical protein
MRYGAVEVDDVQTLHAIVLKHLSHLHGIIAIGGLIIIIALLKADTFTIKQIDGWY